MLPQQLDLLVGFIQTSDQGTSQLHLISEASHVVVTFGRQYHSFRSFFSSAREVAVLRMRHLLIRLMSQDSQCFMGYLSHAFLKCSPWCRSLDHFADAEDTIGRRPLIDHHTYTPKVQVFTQQPRGSDEEQGLTGTQGLKHGLQNPRDVASVLTITVELHGHSMPTRWRTDMLSRRQLHPRHLDKGR
jgi:hypothetical protein